MGVLTHDQLITEALELAGNTSLTTRAQKWLAMLLRDLFGQFPIPVQVAAGTVLDNPITPQTIAAGVQTLDTGALNTVRNVKRVWICTYGQTDFSELTVEHLTSAEMPLRSYTGVSGVAQSRPTRVVAQGVAADRVRLYFDPIPDKTYAVWVMTEGWLTANAAYSGSAVSIYPEDRTVIEGLYAYALRHMNDEREQTAFGSFEGLARRDRTRWANASGANNRLKLSPRVFSRGQSVNPWDWMGPK